MMSMETRPEQTAEGFEKRESTPSTDYVDLMKTNRDRAISLPPTTEDNNLPGMVVATDSRREAKQELKSSSTEKVQAQQDLPALAVETGSEKQHSKDGSDSDTLRSTSKEKDSVDLLLDKLGISMDQTTDPELLKDILHNDMKLDDCPAVTKLVGAKLSNPESMKPMLETIRESIVTKQPELHEFISAALKENLIPAPDEAAQKIIIRSLNHTVLLDAITKGMADDYHVQEDVYKHLLNKRKEMGIREDSFGSAYDIYKAMGNDLFFAAKAKTMDMCFNNQLEFRKEGHIPAWSMPLRQASLELNLAEAIVTDKVHGFSDNAKAGVSLARHIFSKAEVTGNNHFIDYNLKQDWDSLYESWNLAFMTGNMANPQILFPKLLIPQVLDAKPEEYLLNRSMALWMTINFDLFHKMEKKPEVLIPGHEQIARRWGEINAQYGTSLGKPSGYAKSPAQAN
jgi:hypothetical protein